MTLTSRAIFAVHLSSVGHITAVSGLHGGGLSAPCPACRRRVRTLECERSVGEPVPKLEERLAGVVAVRAADAGGHGHIRQVPRQVASIVGHLCVDVKVIITPPFFFFNRESLIE